MKNTLKDFVRMMGLATVIFSLVDGSSITIHMIKKTDDVSSAKRITYQNTKESNKLRKFITKECVKLGGNPKGNFTESIDINSGHKHPIIQENVGCQVNKKTIENISVTGMPEGDEGTKVFWVNILYSSFNG